MNKVVMVSFHQTFKMLKAKLKIVGLQECSRLLAVCGKFELT